MLISVCYDVEDFITPESDDAARWIAQEWERAGARATFFLVGEKARVLRARGREDVLEAMKAHEFAFHSATHSLSPTIAERVAEQDFLSALRTLLESEGPSWDETEAILGRRLLGWGTTGGSWTPALAGMMHQLGAWYAYSPASYGDHTVVWYGNALNFGDFLGGWDPIFANETAFQEGMERLDQALDRILQTNRRWTGLFGGHPSRLIAPVFWDTVNFRHGERPLREEWRSAPVYPPEQRKAIRERFRRFVERLVRDERLEWKPLSEVAHFFDAQRPGCILRDLRRLARRWLEERRPVFTESFTAAEGLVLLAHAVLRGFREEVWYVRPTLFGPNRMPPETGEVSLTAAAVDRLAEGIASAVQEAGFLPEALVVQDQQLSIAQAGYALAARVFRPEQDRITIPSLPPYPPIGDQIAERARDGLRGWPIHPPDLDTRRIEETARLQTWTLKPAWARDELPWDPSPDLQTTDD